VSPPEFYDGVADPIGKAWRAAVGDDVNVQVKSGDDLRIAIDAGLWDALVEEWIPDYDDPLAFLSAFTTRNPTGDALWSNPLYDALIAAARDVASFKAKPEGVASAVPAVKSALEKGDLEGLRRALLAEAEALLLEEAVVVPLWMPVDSGIVRGGVTGLVTGPTGGRRSLLDVHLLGPVSAP
jgi:oligopeptide transport system substrate-binding protein